MEITEVEAMFKHLGLKRYESKALITLLSYGKCTADRVTSISGIPLPRVYDTMNTLVKRGFVSVSKTRPEIFRAIDPNRLFMILEEEEQKKMQKRVKEMKTVMPQLMKQIKKMNNDKPEEKEEVLAVMKKRVNLHKDREEFHNIAKKEILVFAGDMSWVKNVEDLVKQATKRKVKYNIIYSKKGKNVTANANKFKKLGAKVKYYHDTGGNRCIIFDNKVVSLITKKYKTSGDSEYAVITINNPKIADVFTRYFYAIWDKAR